MKNVLLTIFIILIHSSILAQGTDVPDVVSGETWTSAGNPYRVSGDVDVQSLVIEGGVEILVTGNFKFRISGSLSANGTKADSVIFSGSGVWQGIHFDTANVNSSMSYCRVSGAVYGLRTTASEIMISNTKIASNTGNGIEVQGGSIKIERCMVENNGAHGLLVSAAGKAFVYNSIIHGNTQNGFKTDTGILEIRNSIISTNAEGGIFLANAADSLRFENCTIVDNTGGPGIVLFGGTVNGINSIIYSNDFSVGFAVGSVTINYSNIENIAEYTGNGDYNIDLNPGFTGTQAYTLTSNSPCIDTGDPDSRYNDLCFPPSQGNFRNDMGAYGGPGACLWFDPLIISPSLLSFGNVSIGDTATLSVLFRNYRDSSITISSLLLSGADADLFSVETGGFVLTAFDSLRRDVMFSPQNSGNFSAVLLASSSAGSNQISLSGRGIAPNISVDPATLDYGSIRALESSGANVVINNLGQGNLRINELVVYSEYFAVDAPVLPFIIAPFTSDTIAVVFTPDSSGIFSSALQIISNDPDESLVEVPLNGTGIAANISVTNDTVYFGRVNIRSDSLVRFQIANSGNDTLFVSSALVIDPDSLFSLNAGLLPFSIPPGGPPHDLELNFQPRSIGDFTAVLQVQSNDPRRNSLDIILTGTGIAPRVEITTDSVTFGEVVVNTTKTDSIVIRNTGNASLTFSWENLENPGEAFSLLDPPNTMILDPSQTHSIRIVYAPVDTGISSTILPVFSNDVEMDSLRIRISGTGIKPILAITVDSLDFGTVLILENSELAIDIANNGTGGLIVDSAFTASGDKSVFSVLSDFPLIIPALGDPVSLTVRFRPPVRGFYGDTLYLSSNDPDNLLVSLKLSGRGSAPTIEITKTSITFNATYVTETSTESLLVKNSGEGALYLTRATFLRGTSSPYSLGTGIDSLLVEANDSLHVLINFQPEAGGTLTDSLFIYNSDPANERVAVYLTGNSLYDLTPAQIQQYASFDTLQTGRSFIFEAFIRDNETVIQQVFLDLRNAGESNFERLQLSRGLNDVWSVMLPQSRINIKGIEYYLQIFHGGTITNYGTRIQPKKAAVHITNYLLPDQTMADKYQMISVPVNTQNQSLFTLFGDDLGPYDNSEYRFFDWNSADTVFVELSDMSSTLKPGQALWLITRNNKNLDIENSLSVIADSFYTISLKSGWNMFGNPFAFDVGWNMIDISMIQGGIAYFYDGSEWTFPVDRLLPFKGYAVYTPNQFSLRIPKREIAPLSKTASVTPEWQIQIEAHSGFYRDTYNFAGVHEGSHNGIDNFDVFNPPSPENELLLYLGKGLAADYRTPGLESYEYKFTLLSKHKINRIHLLPHNFPTELGWALVCPQTRLKYTEEEFSVGIGNYDFILYIGNQEFIAKKIEHYKDVPQTYVLNQNFPNPFNPSTKIRYQLPRTTRVNLGIYNLLGQRVSTLLNNEFQQEGYYEIQWDGRDESGRLVASGIYFLHFYTPEYKRTIKMILQR